MSIYLKKILTTSSMIFLPFGFLFAQAAPDGEKLFKEKCTACHTIGKGKLVGPDLSGVTGRRAEGWLKRQIKEPDKMIAENDPIAVQLVKESNGVPMAPLGLTDADVANVIAYLNTAAGDAQAVSQEPAAGTPAAAASTGGNSMNGQNLFVGIIRFTNGGPTCNSCHNVNNDAVISGGALAKDLSDAHSRLSEAGVKAFISGNSLPIPQMSQSYNGKPLTDAEVADIVAFLALVDKERGTQTNINYGQYLLYIGVPGAAVLILIFSLMWMNRKRKAVNHKVFDRQVY